MGEKRYRLLMIIGFSCFFLLLVGIGHLLTQHLIMDLKVVYDSLPDLLDNGVMEEYNHYYIVCNNNMGLLLLLGGWFWMLSPFGILPGIDAGLFFAILLNALMIALAVLFCYLSARRIFKTRAGAFFVFLSCFFSPVFYLWTPVFYTDTLSMPFMTGAIYLYLVARDQKNFRRRMGFAVLTVAVSFLGFAVKGSVGVVLVAIGIHLILEHRDGIWKAIALGVGMLVLFLGMNAGYRAFQRNSGIIDFSTEQQVGLPIGLWFLYGSHAPGHYWDEDLQYTVSFDGLDARRGAVNAKILENYRSYTVFSYIEMATEKAVLTWEDGKFTADEFLSAPYRVNFMHHIVLKGQPIFKPYSYYTQGLYLAVMAFFAVGLFRRRKSGASSGEEVIYLTIFGVMLFLNFWETTSRYLINIQPLLLFGAVYGMFYLSDVLKGITDSARKNKKGTVDNRSLND